MIETLTTIDIGPILESYSKLENEMKWFEYGKGSQTCLQYKVGEDPWTSAAGTNRGQELKYTELNPFFKDTIFEELINQYNLKRTRLMWVEPMSCYSMHRDSTPRLHVPMITNSQCFFVFKQGIVQHMPAGYIYKVNTMEQHTFMNCSEERRLHFIGVLDRD
jgi:hypothetical protein